MAMIRRQRTTALVLAGGLLVVPVACGDDDGDDGAARVIETDADGAVDQDADAATAEIVISGFAFTGVGTVAAGTTVVVRNDDSAQHTWTSVDDVFDSGVIAGGDTFSFTFDEPGEYAFFCEFHPSMTGTIVVEG
jgi:plastocyanin